MRGLQVCFEEYRRAGRRGGLTMRGPRRGAVVPASFPGQNLARVGGVMRWGNLQSRLAILGDSFDAFCVKVVPTLARSITPFFQDAVWAFFAPGLLAYLCLLAFETNLFGLSHHLQQTVERDR